MKNLFSGTEIRWWFRSRRSDHLNSLSYWLCVLFFSALLSSISGALWQIRVTEQTRLDAELAQLRHYYQYVDWIQGEPPQALKVHKETFSRQRQALINGVRGAVKAEDKQKDLLRFAQEVKDKGISRPDDAGSIGNSGSKVSPSFTTRSKNGGYTDAEKDVFRNFSRIAKELYDREPDENLDHIERSLAKALGLANEAADSDTSAPHIDVPQMYVASDQGAIAVFPGTDAITGPGWRIEFRPWFIATLGGESQRLSPGLFDADGLTKIYPDILGQLQVRTYTYQFQYGTQQFVICIDMVYRDDGLSGTTPPVVEAKANPGPLSIASLLPGQFHFIHYATFGLSVLFFVALRRVSTSRNSTLTFTRSRELVGKINVEDGLRMQNDELMMKENKIGIDIGKYALVKAKRSKQDKNNIMIHTSVEKARTDLRGCELWEISQNVSETWRLFGVRFESVRATHIGIIRLIYTSEVLPEADWRFFNHLAFSETKAANLRTKLLKLLERNADLCEGSLSIPCQISDAPTLLSAPDVPDWVRSVVNAKELLAVRQRRAYVRLNSEQLGELYSKADVKAVMTSGYFEELLNHGHVDFLLKGKTISRIIALPDETAELNLSDEAWKVLADLMSSYLPASARRLRRVGAPISNQSEPSPVYDFAILDDSCVIVAHFISKATGIDGASGKRTQSTYVVEGYMSWRPADIEFYRGLFSQLAGQAKALTLPGFKLEIIDEQLRSFEAELN